MASQSRGSKQHVFACLWYQQAANDEKGAVNNKQEIMKHIMQSYRLDSVGHLGHIYVQVRARVSLQRSIKQLLANQLLFRASYVTSCTCSTSNGKHDMYRYVIKWAEKVSISSLRTIWFSRYSWHRKSWRISPSTDGILFTHCHPCIEFSWSKNFAGCLQPRQNASAL